MVSVGLISIESTGPVQCFSQMTSSVTLGGMKKETMNSTPRKTGMVNSSDLSEE